MKYNLTPQEKSIQTTLLSIVLWPEKTTYATRTHNIDIRYVFITLLDFVHDNFRKRFDLSHNFYEILIPYIKFH